MASYRYLHYDVFTDHLFGGNQLAVFPDGRGLSEETMQAIAKEMNFAESTFVLPAERADTDIRLRIFTPYEEMPLAGHPTIGSAFALARTGLIPPGCRRFVFGLGVGPVPVTLVWGSRGPEGIEKSDLEFVWMTQLNPTWGEPIRNATMVSRILDLPEAAVLPEGRPAQVVSCGLPCLLVPVGTRGDVDRAAFNRAGWDAFFADSTTPAGCVFLFSVEPGADGATAYSRMFAPDLGVSEDSATGGASGPLGCYLVEHGVVPADTAQRMWSLQGVKMGRPSHVHISIGVDGGKITSVRVGGESVFAGEGTLHVS